MKKLLSILLLAGAALNLSAGSVMKYQTSVVDKDNNAVISSPVTFYVEIRPEGSQDVVYSESVETKTSPAGIAYFNIGENGGATSLDDLHWTDTNYGMKVYCDFGEGKTLVADDTLSPMPRAMYADAASSLVLSSPSGKKFLVTIDDNGVLTATPIQQ